MNPKIRAGILIVLAVAAVATLAFVVLPIVAGAIYSFAP